MPKVWKLPHLNDYCMKNIPNHWNCSEKITNHLLTTLTQMNHTVHSPKSVLTRCQSQTVHTSCRRTSYMVPRSWRCRTSLHKHALHDDTSRHGPTWFTRPHNTRSTLHEYTVVCCSRPISSRGTWKRLQTASQQVPRWAPNVTVLVSPRTDKHC